MTASLVFNHHSLPFLSILEASAALPEFLTICLKAQNVGLTTIFLDMSVDKNWFRLKLADNYYWQDWYNQNNNYQNKDLIRAFRSISTRQPLFLEKDSGEGLDLFEVTLEGESYVALSAAIWNESPITSFPTRIPWNTSPISVITKTIDENETLHVESNGIVNFYSLDIIKQEEQRLITERNVLIKSGRDLYNRRAELFPHLDFCGKVSEQLNGWSESLTLFNQVKESFTAVNNFCEQWQCNHTVTYTEETLRDFGLNHQVSSESETVHKNPSLRSSREFFLPSGEKRLFDKHIKLSRGFRIHFFPDERTRKIYIAYIGKHLKLS